MKTKPTLTTSELCIIQQALGLREMIQINSIMNLGNTHRNDVLREIHLTRSLRNKVIKLIARARKEKLKHA